ncbi:amidohydrolase family protein [Amycolatopsis cynarae]|uniref:Amidohydrolase family protein n=1 Tax=Amycolatopsis cynarae TaxID=2995223 RepID=A0ABY7B786_9PSEU|nr:amidohydrolase family protein [Amycolatopsis sp. HUAS 11-8]WAL67048.1 amidohydrolase family protein [Amycolatopsis sp. HUAS 11-8]
MPDEIIDVWMQQPNARFMAQPWLETLVRWTGMSRLAPTTAETLDAMDAAGVRLGLLSAWHSPHGVLISNDEVAALVERHPDRFAGIATVDLTDPVGAVREIRRCVRDLGFVGVRVVPWLWNLPPNDRRYYPVYVACVEEDVPFCTQIGHTGPLCPSEPGRPIPYLDEVLLDFPQLVVVGGHVGYPWLPEVLSLATKYPNFYVDTSAYAVHRLPAELVEFLRGRGRTRVLFGSNYPMLTPAQCLKKLDELRLGPEAKECFLGGNARRVFSLPL